MENKYGTLRFVAGLKIFIGWATFAIGLILGLYALVQGDNTFSKSELIIITATSVIGGLILVGAGQLIYLLIDIESNTRAKQTQTLTKTSTIESEITDNAIHSSSQNISFETTKSLTELNNLISKEKRKLISAQNEIITNLLKPLIWDKESFLHLDVEYK